MPPKTSKALVVDTKACPPCVYPNGIPMGTPVEEALLQKFGNPGTTRNKDANKLTQNIQACCANGILLGPNSGIMDLFGEKRPSEEKIVNFAKTVLQRANDRKYQNSIALSLSGLAKFQAVIDNPCAETFSAISITNITGGTLPIKANCSLFSRLREANVPRAKEAKVR